MPLFLFDLGEQLVYLLRVVDPHEPAEDATALPVSCTLGGVAQPLRAEDAEPDMSLSLHARHPGDVAPNVLVGEVSKHRYSPRSEFPGCATGNYAETMKTGVPMWTWLNSHSASGTYMRMQPCEAE
jgi:hypothetical protein